MARERVYRHDVRIPTLQCQLDVLRWIRADGKFTSAATASGSTRRKPISRASLSKSIGKRFRRA